MDAPDFPALLALFLTTHLPRTRGCSANTIGSYRDAFVLFLRFTQSAHATSPESVTFADLSAERVEEFTAWLHEERGRGPTTANQRLAAIKSFLKFARSPGTGTDHPGQAGPGHLGQEDTTATDQLPHHRGGQTAARPRQHRPGLAGSGPACLPLRHRASVQEIADLNHADLHADKPVTITVTGKGRKTRTIPLTAQAARIIVKHAMQPFPARPCDPLFLNRRGQRLTRAGIAAILDSHARQPALSVRRMSRNTSRPTCCGAFSPAMHLLEDGVNLIYIRDFGTRQ